MCVLNVSGLNHSRGTQIFKEELRHRHNDDVRALMSSLNLPPRRHRRFPICRQMN